MQRPFNLSFVAVNGAALVINDRPIEVTLTPERRIEQYIMKNCRSWYHYYEHDSQGPQRNLRGSSFVFVTSVVQNSHWALGAWSSPGKPIEVSYSGSATTGDGKFLNISGCWAPPGRRDVMQGPAVERGDPRPRLRTYGDSENLLAPLTQTLFVRGYVIGARDTRPETLEPSKVYPIIYNSWGEFLRKIFSYGIPAILRAAAEPKDLPPPPPPPTAPAVAVDESSSGEDSVELETRELSPPRQLRHPADDIMDTMFKIDPSLGIIVLHDDIVVDLMHCNENPQREIASQSLSRSLEVAKGSGTQTSHGPHPGRQGSLNLPYDLLLHIFSICDARTIGKLRLCSREFHELSTDQAVWLKILERTCSDLNLPLPSFPRSAMSSPDIELLATAWIRFQSLLRTVKDGKPPPHKIIRRIDTKGVIYAFKASSDGRFLFIVHRKGLGVWDLQTPSPTLAGCFEFEIPNARSPILRITLETNNSFLVYANIESPSGK
ncbi:hypothetical protein DL96DRAFT_786008 [Flagelloscypha sp. PMI_526]|nr:hypothetical protein DL96DRAFT_786008 [Flagelloscypha sp. PMI_526]